MSRWPKTRAEWILFRRKLRVAFVLALTDPDGRRVRENLEILSSVK